MKLRAMQESDASAMLSIYKPYVDHTAISLEHEAPPLEEYIGRVQKYIATWAGVVAELDGELLGFAFGSAHRERAAYKWSVETTVYIEQTVQRSGIGRQLYSELLPRLASLGYCNAYAGVALPNLASIRLHQAVGFASIGTFPRVGHKLGQWRDVAWFHRVLREEPPV